MKSKKTGKMVNVTTSANDDLKGWESRVLDAVREAMGERVPSRLTFLASAVFFFSRPQSHFRTNGALKSWAPKHPPGKPDLDKLLRAIWDPCSAVVFHDDSQIVAYKHVAKRYLDPGDGHGPGAAITLEELTEDAEYALRRMDHTSSGGA